MSLNKAILFGFFLLSCQSQAFAAYSFGPEIQNLVEGRLSASKAEVSLYSGETASIQDLGDKIYGASNFGFRLGIAGERAEFGLKFYPSQDFSKGDRSLKGSATTLFLDFDLVQSSNHSWYTSIGLQQQELELRLKASLPGQDLNFSTLSLTNSLFSIGYKRKWESLHLGFEYRLTRTLESANASSFAVVNGFAGLAKLKHLRLEGEDILVSLSLRH